MAEITKNEFYFSVVPQTLISQTSRRIPRLQDRSVNVASLPGKQLRLFAQTIRNVSFVKENLVCVKLDFSSLKEILCVSHSGRPHLSTPVDYCVCSIHHE